MTITFHRAFDISISPKESITPLFQIGVYRILTSGQKDKAINGIDFIKNLVEQANNKISIVAVGGLNPNNIKIIEKETKITECHFAARKPIETHFPYENNLLANASVKGKFRPSKIGTDIEFIKQMISQFN